MASAHLTVESDEGAFMVVRCSCGWRSMARRSRGLARHEAADHLQLMAAAADLRETRHAEPLVADDV